MHETDGPTAARRRFLLGAAAAAGAAWVPLGRVPVAEGAGACVVPPGFPAGIELYRQAFESWSGELVVDDLWTCRPADAADVVVLAEWARSSGYRLRPRGAMHGWSPLCVAGDETCETAVVLLDTTGLGGRDTISFGTRNGVPTVTAGGGTLLDDLHEAMEEAGVGLAAAPALGAVTLGGVLAIDGHGTAVPAAGEQRPVGQTYGSLSNLVLSLDVVAWDPGRRAYALQTIDRTDRRAPALLTNLGRAFVVRATLQASPNQRLRCVSTVDTTADELFAPPGSPGRTFERMLDESGRVEAIWYVFTDRPWMKSWRVAPAKPLTSRAVDGPYNYPFSDNIPEELALLGASLVQGNGTSTPVFGQMLYAASAAGLVSTASLDLWGWSQDLLRYIKPTTIRVTQTGHVVLTRRDRVQEVVHRFAEQYGAMLDAYRAREEYPVSLGVEIRVSGLERSADVDAVPGAEPPLLSALHEVADHPDRDTAVWFDVLSFPETPGRERFSRELEAWFFDDLGADHTVRVEWSKGWAYTDDATWSDPDVLRRRIPDSQRDGRRSGRWDAAARTLDALDPAGVWRTDLHDRLFGPVTP